MKISKGTLRNLYRREKGESGLSFKNWVRFNREDIVKRYESRCKAPTDLYFTDPAIELLA